MVDETGNNSQKDDQMIAKSNSRRSVLQAAGAGLSLSSIEGVIGTRSRNDSDSVDQVRFIQIGVNHETTLKENSWRKVRNAVDTIPVFYVSNGTLYVMENRVEYNIKSLLKNKFVTNTQNGRTRAFQPVGGPVLPRHTENSGPIKTDPDMRPIESVSYSDSIEYQNAIVTPSSETAVKVKYGDISAVVEESEQITKKLRSFDTEILCYNKETEAPPGDTKFKDAKSQIFLNITNHGKLDVEIGSG